MFKCECGGVLLVQEIEPFPEDLNKQEQLYYVRKCKGICNECGNVQENLSYDNPEQNGVQ